MTKSISIQQYTANILCSFADELGMNAEECAKELLEKDRKMVESKFAEFSEAFCNNKNLLGKGVYSKTSFDGNTFVYEIN